MGTKKKQAKKTSADSAPEALPESSGGGSWPRDAVTLGPGLGADPHLGGDGGRGVMAQVAQAIQ